MTAPQFFSAIFTGKDTGRNPKLESGHPRQGRNTSRVQIPKGISSIIISTSYPKPFTITYQPEGDISSQPGETVFDSTTQGNKSGGGVFKVRATTSGGDIFINTGVAMVAGDEKYTWGLEINTIAPEGII